MTSHQLMFPTDLHSWREWTERRDPIRHRVRALRRRLNPSQGPSLMFTGARDPDVLIAFDSVNPRTAQLFEDLIVELRARGASTAVVDAGDTRLRASAASDTYPMSSSVRAGALLTIGNFAPAGHAAWERQRRRGAPTYVVQHGLLTPFAPPLPIGSHHLAWSEADGAFWQSSRADTTYSVVGSHIFTRPAAARHSALPEPPLFLGQMHGAELSWRTKAMTAIDFCRMTGALYRPHPAENDRISTAMHAVLRGAGVRFADGTTQLAAHNGPVVGMFSTGILEAASSGLPAYGFAVDPPAWLPQFWQRYDIRQWGAPQPSSAPTSQYSDTVRTIVSEVLAR